MNKRWLTALPVYNEVDFVDDVLDQVLAYSDRVLAVDDGSTDGTTERLQRRNDIIVVQHEQNQGYGAALKTAFRFAVEEGFAGVVTIDCDGQHQPRRIPRFIRAAESADIVSGSRYLKKYEFDDAPPPQRLFINRRITSELNKRFNLNLTDAFCGFKAYRAEALRDLAPRITDNGYAMPLELWAHAAALGLTVMEIPVPLIYLDLNRSFGGSLDHAETRLRYYNQVLDRASEIAFADAPASTRRQSGCQ